MNPMETLKIDVEWFETNVNLLHRLSLKIENQKKFNNFISRADPGVTIQDNRALVFDYKKNKIPEEHAQTRGFNLIFSFQENNL